MTSDELGQLWEMLRRYRNEYLTEMPKHRAAALAVLDSISVDHQYTRTKEARMWAERVEAVIAAQRKP